jgi:hypothetical protein
MADLETHFAHLALDIHRSRPVCWRRQHPDESLKFFLAQKMLAADLIEATVSNHTIEARDLTDKGRALIEDERMREQVQSQLADVDLSDL